MPEKLPKGWVKTTLGDITQPSRERALPAEVPGMQYVGLEHIEPQTMKLLGHGYAQDTRSSAVRFSKGDVLYGKMRPYLNKVWVAEFDGICSAEFLVFPKHDSVDCNFLALRLNSEDFATFANRLVSGERPRVDFAKLSGFSILLPPLPEQKRIVAKLNAALAGVQRAETAAKRAHKRLKHYRAAILHSAITGELTSAWRKAQRLSRKNKAESGEALLQHLLDARRMHWEKAELKHLRIVGKDPKAEKWKTRYTKPIEPDITALPKLPSGWTWATVAQIAAFEPRSITDGPFGSNLKTSHYTEHGPRVIRLQNIGDGVFIDEKTHISRKHYESLKKYAVYEGDLVIRALGIPAPRASKIPRGLGPAIVKADCIRLKVAAEFVLSDYILLALNAPPTQQRTEQMIHGVGRPRLNLSEIKLIPLPFPPLAEQTEIVREVKHHLSASDKLAASLEQKLTQARASREGLLREAFTGHLVSQDSRDEPASFLMERILNARKTEAQKRRQKDMPKTKAKAGTMRRLLLDVLRENTEPMTPEELFHEAHFEPAQVDLFYRELTLLRDKLREEKPKASEAKLWPHRANVRLQLKKGAGK